MAYDSGVVWSNWWAGFGRVGIRLVIPDPAPGATTVVATWENWVHGTGGTTAEIDWTVTVYNSAGAQYGAVKDYHQANYTIPGSGVVDVLVSTWHPTIPVYLAGSQGSSRVNLHTQTWSSGDSGSSDFNINAASIPVVPPYAPQTPTGLTVSRVNDGQVNVSANFLIQAAYNADTAYIERSTDGGSWVQIYSGSAVQVAAISYPDTTVSANHSYAYRVRLSNVTGYSAYATSGWYATTPAAPTLTSVSKSGASIIVNWSNNAPSANKFAIWHAANGVWDGAALATVTGGASYTHTGANTSVTHQYRIQAITDNTGSGTLTSAYSNLSAVVQLLAAPNAPVVTLDKTVYDAATGVLSVQILHQPTDSTATTGYQFRYKKTTDGAWTTATVAVSGVPNGTPVVRNVAAATLANGFTYEIQAATKGDYASYGAFSASQLVQTSAVPQATATTPANGSLYTKSKLTVVGQYYDPEGSAQASGVFTLKDSAGNILETVTVSGPALTYTFATAVVDGGSYTWTYQVQDGSSLWSGIASSSFTVAYSKPPVADLNATLGDGSVTLVATNPAPGAGQIAAVYNQLLRNGIMVADNLPLNFTYVDNVPIMGVPNAYSVRAVTALPSTSTSPEVSVTPPAGSWVYLNAGPGFGIVAKLRIDPDLGEDAELDKELVTYIGQVDPVELAGLAVYNTLSLSGRVATSGNDPRLDRRSTWPKFLEVARQAAPVCYRDPLGRRMFCSIGKVSVAHDVSTGLTSISTTLTKVGTNGINY